MNKLIINLMIVFATAFLFVSVTEAKKGGFSVPKVSVTKVPKPIKDTVKTTSNKVFKTLNGHDKVTPSQIRKDGLKDFKKSREQALKENDGLCVYCNKKPATEGDHKESLKNMLIK